MHGLPWLGPMNTMHAVQGLAAERGRAAAIQAELQEKAGEVAWVRGLLLVAEEQQQAQGAAPKKVCTPCCAYHHGLGYRMCQLSTSALL